MNRRDFLKVLGASGLIGVLPTGCARRAAKTDATAVEESEAILVNDVHTGLNPTLVDRVVYPDSLDAIREPVRSAKQKGEAVCVAGARHAMGAQQFATGGVLIDMTALGRVLNFDPEAGTVEVEAGTQWPILIGYLLQAQKGQPKQWGIAQKQSADWLSMGGSLGSNIHGTGLRMKPFIQDVESFVLIDADGKERRCSRNENSELFRLAVGGYGLFGIVYSVTLRLVPRQKVEQVAEVIFVDDLMSAYEGRIADGFLYGTFLYNSSPESDDFLHKGVFTCYRPVDAAEPVPDYEEQPPNDQWMNLRYLAHADKDEFFRRVSGHYISASGTFSWSDTHQMGTYIKGYHGQLDKMLGGEEASDITTEVYVPREDLAEFVNEVREDFRKDGVNVIFGDIGVIERDDESFLAYANQPYARFSCNIHTVHSPDGLEHSRRAFRRLIDVAARRGGSYYLTHHKFATPEQVKSCYPQFKEFLRLKAKYDPEERFQSDWYRHHKEMIGGV